MPNPTALAGRHTWLREAVFYLKASVLTARRHAQNLLAPPPRCRPHARLATASVLAASSSALWNPADTPATWLLTAGKVENLRRAARRLHGLEVPAGAVFSFWRHVGAPSRRRGYVPGREIREGCVVPTVAGGLCQLSNALYDAALQAGFATVERHRHTRVIAGSLAELDRDATVKWSYLDLRFRAPVTFRLEVELTADTLRVQFRAAEAPGLALPPAEKARPASQLNDCYACGNRACFKHPGPLPAAPATTRTTFVLDAYWPEFAHYVQATASPTDVLLVPLRAASPRAGRYGWPGLAGRNLLTVSLAARWRQVRLALAARAGRNVFAQALLADRQLALAAARRLAFDSTHLVVAQALLPFLWEAGVLAGRTFDVLLTRLPAEVLHARLDAAHARHPASSTLRDFRAPAAFVAAESRALTQARRLLTPHHELADLFRHKAVRLPWAAPAAASAQSGPGPKMPGSKILFPASAVGRKGAYEVRRLAQQLGLPLVVAGRAAEHAGFWQAVVTEPAGPDPLAGVGLVVYPAYVEHQPRLLLRALAAGIPVVASLACGLPPGPGLTLVPAGDYAALYQVVEAILAAGR